MNLLKRQIAALDGTVRVLSPSCREVARLQSIAVDGSLSLGQRAGLRVHLVLCKWCRRYDQQLQFMRQAVGKEPLKQADATPQTLSPTARERIKRSLSGGK